MTQWLQQRGAEMKAALIVLTRLPLPELSPFPPQGRVVWAYPIAGAAVGLIGGMAMLLAGLALPAAMAAVLGLAVSVLLTGALHEDGLADFWDGIGGGRARAEKLAIMRDSHLGSYGALALILSFAARLTALAALGPLGALAFVTAQAMSRGALALPMRLNPPARSDGLIAEAGKPGPIAFMAAIGLPLALSLVVLPGASGLIAAAAACAAAWLVGLIARFQVGGITGDVLGAAVQMAEIAFLWTIAASLAA
ncbi:MAG: adenosylcobinamide-GDP ribazoletransferase [Hyphomicrobiales bacterium]|nr:MAG: adenosylcobinamide-GDP ribazoletransferase [Hyphomicrobiales bacterium]